MVGEELNHTRELVKGEKFDWLELDPLGTPVFFSTPR